ncbi:MAG: hypothetical protein Q8M03_13190 [Legionella sp.]|nr:hypothetical protein [Legionella sp.]
MRFPLTEPTNPRYIWIHQETNRVYILMPIVSGTEIGLDNTCKSVYALQEFFGKSRDVHQRAVLDELITYKKALEFDMLLIDEHSELKSQKQERLEQINQYTAAIEAILNSDVLNSLNLAFPAYPDALKMLMEHEDSNLYTIVLRPHEKDNFLRFGHPVFSVERDSSSFFHAALVNTYQDVAELPGAKERFYNSILALLEGQEINFEQIRTILKEHIENKLKIKVNFDLNSIKNPDTKDFDSVTKDYIDRILGCDEEQPATVKDYIETLLNVCSPELLEGFVDSPFYTRQNAEELSIITQFFLGVINAHCRANALSSVNFGEVLDNSDELSTRIAALVLSITSGASIEDALLEFVNVNIPSFGLERPLTPIDQAQIKKRFWHNYSEIKEAPHFDEFTLLFDSEKGLFVSHQGSICCNLAEFTHAALPELGSDYFARICVDFKTLNTSITPTNPSVHAAIEIDVEELLEKITDEDQLDAVLKKLPEDQKRLILASPQAKRLQLPKLLLHVAKGQQDEAKSLLEANAEAQLLLQKEKFTDYSGRTFHCTAYEYAYWAKDTHMCRMLEQYMDDETKREMLILCETMDTDGLAYTQHGEDTKSAHFDFMPLKIALQEYVNGYPIWTAENNWDAMSAAWMNVGKAQRDVPAHVAHEYCRGDRSFSPLPEFNEPTLPRVLTFCNWDSGRDESWFPLTVSVSSGLGVDFAIYAGDGSVRARLQWVTRSRVLIDLAAVNRLDEVRTNDLTQSQENLRVVELASGLGRS